MKNCLKNLLCKNINVPKRFNWRLRNISENNNSNFSSKNDDNEKLTIETISSLKGIPENFLKEKIAFIFPTPM